MWKIDKTNLIHIVLGHSYLVYFASILIGLAIDIGWQYHLEQTLLTGIVGWVLIVVGPAIVYWAQHSSVKLAVKRICDVHGICPDDFRKGPYAFTRSPTNFGLFLMIIGLGFILSSVSVVVTTIIAFLLTRYVFIRKEEQLLEEKYGDAYRDYKSQVRI